MKPFKTVMVTFALGCLVGMLTGCGSVEGMQAETECRRFVADDYCRKVSQCDTTTSQADCVSIASTVLDCSTVTKVNGNFVTCQADLGSETCGVFWDGVEIHQPASCLHIFVK